jgi:hypothetical protein
MFNLGHSERRPKPQKHNTGREVVFTLSFGKRGGRRERERRGGVAYLFATRYQPLYQHRLSLLRVVQLLPELLVLPHQTITP